MQSRDKADFPRFVHFPLLFLPRPSRGFFLSSLFLRPIKCLQTHSKKPLFPLSSLFLPFWRWVNAFNLETASKRRRKTSLFPFLGHAPTLLQPHTSKKKKKESKSAKVSALRWTNERPRKGGNKVWGSQSEVPFYSTKSRTMARTMKGTCAKLIRNS